MLASRAVLEGAFCNPSSYCLFIEFPRLHRSSVRGHGALGVPAYRLFPPFYATAMQVIDCICKTHSTTNANCSAPITIYTWPCDACQCTPPFCSECPRPKAVGSTIHFSTTANTHTQVLVSVTPQHRRRPHCYFPFSKNLRAASAPFSSRIGLAQLWSPSARCTD